MNKMHYCFVLVMLMGLAVRDTAAQGSLVPPGAPASSMKTLQQVEPRFPISSPAYSITRPGSYYLETNLTTTGIAAGIMIFTNNVTIDLMGFSIEGATNALNGIGVSGVRKNIVIRNGVIQGFAYGVEAYLADNSRISDLRVYACRNDGIRIGQYATVENCQVAENKGDGIKGYQSVSVVNCGSSSNGADGIDVGPESSVVKCLVTDNQGSGIRAAPKSTVEHCQVIESGVSGVVLVRDSAVRHCEILYSGQEGVLVSSNSNYVEDNHVAGGGVGLVVNGHGNIIANNVVQDNADNYDLSPTNSLDLIISQIPESIDWPARLRLNGDLYGYSGIIINSDNVTVDLNGFSLVGRNSGSPGINVQVSCRDLVVRNGTLRGWAGEGLDASLADNGMLENVSAYANGGDGLVVGDGWSISHCRAQGNGGDGLMGGQSCSADNCVAYQNTGAGIYLSHGSNLHDCTAKENQSHGIAAGGNTIIRDCTSTQNGADGLSVYSMSLVRDNNSTYNGGDGIQVVGEKSRIEGNHVAFNDTGIRAGGTDIRNLFIRNTASANVTADFNISTNNAIGQILNASVPATITNANPWANIRY